jgi:hypothetical protein
VHGQNLDELQTFALFLRYQREEALDREFTYGEATKDKACWIC